MDDAVALVIAAPAIALCIWFVTFAGDTANAQGRAVVAAHAAAVIAAENPGTDPADTAQRTAVGATLSACDTTNTVLDHADTNTGTAAVTVSCHYSDHIDARTFCVTGYAQTDPAVTGHVLPATCPE